MTRPSLWPPAMKRREVLALLAGGAALPPLLCAGGAHAQQSAMPVIGWLSARTPETDALVLPAFRQGLNAQGYVEGRNVAIEYRWAEGHYDRIPGLAADLIRQQVALLIRTLPLVAEEKCFALKGGTAINLFIRNMPRLSVDIDLTYLPVQARPESLAAIDAKDPQALFNVGGKIDETCENCHSTFWYPNAIKKKAAN